MSVIIAFTIKHFICDFLLQFPRHFENKGYYGRWGGIEHALIHGIGTFALCFYFKLPFALAGIDTLAHYHIDFLKMWAGRKLNLTPASPLFWHFLGLDQLLHYLTYWIMIAYVTA